MFIIGRMNYTQGKETSITFAKGGVFVPLPYSLETLRECAAGYSLPSVIGEIEREKRIEIGREIQGCVTTRIEKENVLTLFGLISVPETKFDIYADRVNERKIYKNVSLGGFEFRAENGGAYFLRMDIKGNRDSFATDWTQKTPLLIWENSKEHRTCLYDGRNVHIAFENGTIEKLPLVYRFELEGVFGKTKSFVLKLYYPLSEKFYPRLQKIDRIIFDLGGNSGVILEMNDLKPFDDMTGTAASDTVLVCQRFSVDGKIRLVSRNETANEEISL